MTPANEEARRYMQLADDDAAAFRGLLNLPEVKFRLACFHAQQAVEKLLKAWLIKSGIALPYSPEEPTQLNPFAVTFRYDDTDIPLIPAAEVVRMVDVCAFGQKR